MVGRRNDVLTGRKTRLRGSESSAQTTTISCFFNKRKRNVIVLFVSTFKNTILVLIPGSKWRETKRLNAEKAKTTREKEREKGRSRKMGKDLPRRMNEWREGKEWKEYLRRY